MAGGNSEIGKKLSVMHNHKKLVTRERFRSVNILPQEILTTKKKSISNDMIIKR